MNARCPDFVMNRHGDVPARARCRMAFTTVELLISMALMIVAMIGVVSVFNISSGAAAKTSGHADMLEASNAMQSELAHQLSHIVPGLLIIESPPPTMIRAEMPGGPKWLRLRHDRLVFIATGDSNEFQSFTDPTRGIPITDENAEPFASQQALMYFGPGIPVLADGTTRPIDGASPDASLAAFEWTFAHRSILLMQGITEPPSPPPQWSGSGLNISSVFTAPGGMLAGGPLDLRYLQAKADLVFSDGIQSANAQAIVDAVRLRPFLDFQSLWQPNWAPVTASLADPLAAADFYTRAGFTFLPRLADFRIEWTDGRRIDPNGPDDDPATMNDNDTRTRWFGLAPADTTIFPATPRPDPSVPTTIDAMQYQARMRAVADPNNPSNPNLGNPDNSSAESAAFRPVLPDTGFPIESSSTSTGITPDASSVAPDVDAGYRAVWRIDNWQYRPKALRFTYRLYDAGLRLSADTTVDLNENGIADPDFAPSKAIVKRLGQEFSIVVALP